VIYESAYWKGDLLRRSSILRNYLVQRRWPEASFAKCEQTVMVGFYSIRKLIEATKLTDVLTKTPVQLVRYPSKGRPVTRINRHEVGELYDFNSSEKLNLSLVELCHQFIHRLRFRSCAQGRRGTFCVLARLRSPTIESHIRDWSEKSDQHFREGWQGRNALNTNGV
jgi:hypothetical protein